MSTAAMTPPPGQPAQDPDALSESQNGIAAGTSTGGAPVGGGMGASAPPQPSNDDGIVRQIITAVQTFRMIAKAYPKAAAPIAEMMDQVPKVMAAIQGQIMPGTAAAPPTGT